MGRGVVSSDDVLRDESEPDPDDRRRAWWGLKACWKLNAEGLFADEGVPGREALFWVDELVDGAAVWGAAVGCEELSPGIVISGIRYDARLLQVK